jgi:hypothetical protein
MPVLDDLKQLKHTDFVIATVTFISIVAPGILILQMFKPTLFAALDTIKVIFLAISFTLPIVAVNFFGIGYAGHLKRVRQREPLNDSHGLISFFAMLATFSIFYSAIALAYFCGLSFKNFVEVVCVIQAVAIFLEYLAIRKAKAIPIKGLPGE